MLSENLGTIIKWRRAKGVTGKQAIQFFSPYSKRSHSFHFRLISLEKQYYFRQALDIFLNLKPNVLTNFVPIK